VNGDEVRNVRLPRGGPLPLGSTYDASEVDDLLDRIAAELDVGRAAGPLIADAVFRMRSRGYATGAVDWLLEQLRRREDPSERAKRAAAFQKSAGAIMECIAFCERCEMDRAYCEHGLAERRQAARSSAVSLLISPRGMAHFPGCPHKGDDPDYDHWAELNTPARGRGWVMESTFALLEVIVLPSSLRRGAWTVLIMAPGSERSRWRRSAAGRTATASQSLRGMSVHCWRWTCSHSCAQSEERR
jgi:DivIVA domain-containing protein